MAALILREERVEKLRDIAQREQRSVDAVVESMLAQYQPAT